MIASFQDFLTECLLTEARIAEINGYIFDKSNINKHPSGEGLWMFEYQTETGELRTIDTPEPMMLRQAEVYVAKEAASLNVPKGTTFQIRFK